MRFGRFIVAGTGAIFGLFGLVFMINPGILELAGIVATDPTGSNDIRAVYGGLEIGVGLLLLWSSFRGELVRPALVAIAVMMGCMVVARVIGWVLSGFPEPLGFLLHGMEFTGCLLALTALRVGKED